MVARMNEYLIQQTQKPIGEIAGEELDWDNALYFFLGDPEGKLGIFSGFEVFPNRALQRATLHIRHGREQYRSIVL